MKKKLLISAAIFFTLAASAQSPDFTGTWKLNTEKSTLGDQFSMAPREIIIAQKGNDMTMERHNNFQDQEFTTNDKFTLDGKECTNTGWMDSQKKTTVEWSEDKLSLKFTTKVNMGDGGEMTLIEILKMDSENMVIQATASSSYGDLVETMVYNKQ